MKRTITPQREDLITVFLERNQQINLSALRDRDSVWQKHIIDSLIWYEIFSELFTANKNIVDIGTWWWFPLLPLAMQCPLCTFTWIDARKKKIIAINEMIATLKIPNCTAVRSRIEEHNKRYDLVTARAVTYADQLLERSLPVLKKWWHMLFWKMFTFEEDATIREHLYKHNLTLVATHTYTLTDDTTQRMLYLIKK